MNPMLLARLNLQLIMYALAVEGPDNTDMVLNARPSPRVSFPEVHEAPFTHQHTRQSKGERKRNRAERYR